MTRRGGGAPTAVEPPSDAVDRGSATVWAAITVAALVAVLSAVLGLVGAVGGRHRAEAAADLAALAAAGQAVRGEAVACRRAGDVAAGSGGRVVLCRVRGAEAVVEVEVALRATVFGAITARARARAGPAQPPLAPPPGPFGDTGAALPQAFRNPTGTHARPGFAESPARSRRAVGGIG